MHQFNQKIDIFHVQLLPIMSGVQKSMLDLLVRLNYDSYNFTVICQNKGELTDVLERRKINYILLPELKREINPIADLRALIKLTRIFKQYKVDIVHTHSSKPGFLGRVAAKLAGVKFIIHTVQGFSFHEFSSKRAILVFTLLERIAGLVSNKIIIVNSNDYCYALKKKIAPKNKLAKIYNGIDLDEYHLHIDTAQKKEKLAIPNEWKVIGFVGRLWEQKAPQDFLLTIPFVLEKLPNSIFLIVGDGHLRNSLEALAQKLRIEDHVKFLGWRNDVPEILKILDVFVQTSLWEGLSLSILEAMASEKPVIATNIKGNNELVVDGVTGFLVPPHNPESMANCIIKLLQDRQLAESMGKLGRKRVQEKFDIKLHVEQIKNIYDQFFSV